MKSVLTTGTSSGIGLATAIGLGEAGHTVYATMRNLDRSAPLRDAIAQEKLPVSILPLDVTSDESVATAVEKIRSDGNTINVLVNNAGVACDQNESGQFRSSFFAFPAPNAELGTRRNKNDIAVFPQQRYEDNRSRQLRLHHLWRGIVGLSSSESPG
jgi:NAD(P)-dependent dehydrogenase (short-subunit alcohol dehydrogenase family)